MDISLRIKRMNIWLPWIQSLWLWGLFPLSTELMLDSNTLWLWHSEVIALDMRRAEVSWCPGEALGTNSSQSCPQTFQPEAQSFWFTQFPLQQKKSMWRASLSVFQSTVYSAVVTIMVIWEHSLSSSNCIFWLSSFFL